MSSDFYRVGRPLSRVGLFQLVTDEVFKDGLVEEWENTALNTLGAFLKLDPATARMVARRSASRFKAGSLGGHRPMDACALYERALYFVCSDGRVDSKEERMLRGIRLYFGLDDEMHARLSERVRQANYARHYDPELAPLSSFDPLFAQCSESPFDDIEPSTAIRLSSATFDRAVEPVNRLFSRAQEGHVDQDEGAQAKAIVPVLVAAIRELAERRKPAVSAMARLAPVLVLVEDWSCVESFVTVTTHENDDPWHDVPELYAMLFTHVMRVASMTKRPALAEKAAALALRGAQGFEGASYRWTALASTLHLASVLAYETDSWDFHDRLLHLFEAVPPSATAAVPSDWARFMGSWIRNEAGEGAVERCWKGLEAFLELADQLDDREVRREYARCLGAVILVLSSVEPVDVAGLEALSADLCELVERYLGDRSVATVLVHIMAPMIRGLSWGGGNVDTTSLTSLLDKVRRRHGEDEDLSRGLRVLDQDEREGC